MNYISAELLNKLYNYIVPGYRQFSVHGYFKYLQVYGLLILGILLLLTEEILHHLGCI